jgi:hypothetical protein
MAEQLTTNLREYSQNSDDRKFRTIQVRAIPYVSTRQYAWKKVILFYQRLLQKTVRFFSRTPYAGTNTKLCLFYKILRQSIFSSIQSSRFLSYSEGGQGQLNVKQSICRLSF